MKCLAPLTTIALLCACGSEGVLPTHAASTPAFEPPPPPVNAPMGGLSSGEIGGEDAASREQASRGAAPGEADTDGRKIVRTGQLSVIVESWEPFERQLRTWLEAHGGHLSDLSLERWAGEVGHGSITIRVPAEQLDPLLSWTAESVEISSLSVHSADVTARWIDVEARLSALQQTESRLLSLLDQRTADLADVLAAERELGRVRGDIESFEGQRRALADQVQLSTLTVDVSVRQSFEPIVGRSLPAQIGDTWSTSLSAMATAARGLLLFVVFFAPWALSAGAGLLGLWWVLRLASRKTRR